MQCAQESGLRRSPPVSRTGGSRQSQDLALSLILFARPRLLHSFSRGVSPHWCLPFHRPLWPSRVGDVAWQEASGLALGGSTADANSLSPGPCCPSPHHTHAPATDIKQAPWQWAGAGGTSLLGQRCASLSSSWRRRWRTRPVVLARSWDSVSFAFFMCSSCSRRRAFTCERPVLLDGATPQWRGRGWGATPSSGAQRPRPRTLGPADPCSGVQPPHCPWAARTT